MIDNGLSKANTGKLVDVSTTAVSQKIYDHTGKEVTGVQLKALSSGESNTPGNSTSGSSGSGSGSGSSSDNTQDNAAGKMTASFMALVVGAAVAAASVL